MTTNKVSRIAIMSHVVIDEISTPRGGFTRSIGGAGAFAAVGASLVSETPAPSPVCGVGSRDGDFVRGWLVDRGVDISAVFEAGEFSPVTRIVYDERGERSETPTFGLDHFNANGPSAAAIPWPSPEIAAMYIFRGLDGAFWDQLLPLIQTITGPTLWEIASDVCEPTQLHRVRDLAASVDLFSLNVSEARRLLDARAVPDIMRQFRDWPTPVILRMGELGSAIISDKSIWQIPAAPAQVVDPTGGGNSYSGAFISAFAQTGHLLDSARTAAAVAAAVISQVGAPEVDADLRDAIRAAARQLTTTVVAADIHP